MTTPRSTADYYRRQQRLIVKVILGLRQVWQQMDPAVRWAEQYNDGQIGERMFRLVASAQVAAARDADQYIAAVLAELDLVPDESAGVLQLGGFSGQAGDGRPVDSLLAQAVPLAGRKFNTLRREQPKTPVLERPDEISDVAWESLVREREQSADVLSSIDFDQAAQSALADAGQWLESITATILIDTARAAESAATAARPSVGGYVRMLNPSSCSRCVVLAGKFYRWNTGFDRHPLCDCRHIPSNESIAGDLTVDPNTYFDALTRGEQDKTFTVAGAQAIRDGADVGQVVNARRGMEKAQVYGRDAVYTREGITRFGQYGRARGAFEAQRGRRYEASKHVRLMPESVYREAVDRDDAIRLLKLSGFLL